MPGLDLEAIRNRHTVYRVQHRHDTAFECCTAHATADDVPALIAEIERLRVPAPTADMCRAALNALPSDAANALGVSADADILAVLNAAWNTDPHHRRTP